MLDGTVLRGRNGMAGEFGHMQVVPDGQPCECGGRGCWEQYCSGNALVRLARDQVGRMPTLLDELCGGDPARLTGPMVSQAAEEGDLLARQAFASVGDWLGRRRGQPGRGPRPRRRRRRRRGVRRPATGCSSPPAPRWPGRWWAAATATCPTWSGARFGPEAGAVGAADLAQVDLR